jgi:hypothetical protein
MNFVYNVSKFTLKSTPVADATLPPETEFTPLITEKQMKLLNLGREMTQVKLSKNTSFADSIENNNSLKYLSTNLSSVMNNKVSNVIKEQHLSNIESKLTPSVFETSISSMINANDVLSNCVSQMASSIAPMLLSNFIMPVIGNIASCMINMFLSEIFSNESEQSNMLSVVLNEIREGFRIIGEQLQTIRREMHEGFDKLKCQIDTMVKLLNYGIYNMTKDLEKIQIQLSRTELVMIKRFDIIDKNILLLENLIGSSMLDISWFNIKDVLTNYSNYNNRFNKIMDYKDLIKTASVIENTIINPPMLKWLNGKYLLDKQHTSDIDLLYFRNNTFGNIIGWFTNKDIIDHQLIKTLFDIYFMVLSDIRTHNKQYDVQKVILNNIKQSINNYKIIEIPSVIITNKNQEIIDMFNQIDNTILTNNDVLTNEILNIDNIIKPYNPNFTTLYRGFDGFSDCNYWDYKICDGNYPYTNRIQRWIMSELKYKLNIFMDEYKDNTNIILYPINNALTKTGVYDIPIVFKNHQLNKIMNNSSFNIFKIAEKKNLGKLHYEYHVEFIQNDIMTFEELDVAPGSYGACYQSSSELYGGDLFTDCVIGKKLYYNFKVLVYWIPYNSNQNIMIVEMLNNNHESIPLSRDGNIIIDNFSEKYAKLLEQHSKGLQIGHPVSMSFVHSNIGRFSLHPYWSHHYIEKTIKQHNFNNPTFTSNYEIVKNNLIKKIESNNLIIINKIIEDTQTYWNNIRKNLRWLYILNKEQSLLPLSMQIQTQINILDNMVQLFDKSYNAFDINIMYSTFKQNTLSIINNTVEPVILPNECLNIICDTIDSLIQMNNIEEINEDSEEDNENFESKLLSYKQENDMLKSELRNMNNKLDLLMSMMNK